MAHGNGHGHEAGHASTQSVETLDQLIAHYVAGALPGPLNALVGAHVELKDSGRRLARGFETLAGRELEAMEPKPIQNRDAMMRAIFSSNAPALSRPAAAPSCSIFPKSLIEFTGHTAQSVPWRTKLPGFAKCGLPRKTVARRRFTGSVQAGPCRTTRMAVRKSRWCSMAGSPTGLATTCAATWRLPTKPSIIARWQTLTARAFALR